jgi:hypothetical protein
MNHETVSCSSFEDSALLLALGFACEGTTNGGRRVVLHFADPGGHASDTLQRHRSVGVEVNSAAYADGLSRAKRLIFSTRDGEAGQ